MGIVRKYNRIKLIRYGNTKTTPFLTECHENLSKTQSSSAPNNASKIRIVVVEMHRKTATDRRKMVTLVTNGF